MVRITFVEHDGAAHVVDAQPGMTLMEAAVWNHVKSIYASCGGDGGCATCHVYLDRRWTPIAGGRSRREISTLRYALKTNEESRLSCYIKVTDEMDGILVRLPERQF